MKQRELKFRVWDKELKKFWNRHKTYYSIYAETTTVTLKEDLQVLLSFSKDFDVIVQQFIGLRDKKGKEIYEGDIVRRLMIDVSTIHVEFMEVKFFNGYFSHYNGLNIFNDSENIEVVGNIFENPELLKKS
jgi:uncharacterized phage protein (TIGR01671 family)